MKKNPVGCIRLLLRRRRLRRLRRRHGHNNHEPPRWSCGRRHQGGAGAGRAKEAGNAGENL